MSIFVQKLNPITGTNGWIVQNEDYDYHQEVARSSFADMLHDTERNRLYEAAIKTAIERIHGQGRLANVLDIGTGTGLLAMMAARHGADTIVACEAFTPMSECAKKIIARNNLLHRIQLIPKRSTELLVGPEGDLPNRCNILVTEVFDTELIGEGALSTFGHAHRHLLETDCIVIPQSATIYAQIVECRLAQNWNRLFDIVHEKDGKILIEIPESIRHCAGSASVHDLQLNQLPDDAFQSIAPPLPVLRFDWSGRTPFVNERCTISDVKAERAGRAQVVFMWWDLVMDIDQRLVLSCAPRWTRPETGELPWRDHWMQAIYYLPEEVIVNGGDQLHLVSCHDEYSLWFNLKTDLRLCDKDYIKPICECGLHVAFARTRLGQMNDSNRNKKYLSLLEKYVTKDSTILILSDGFYLGLAAAKFGAKKIYYIDTNHLSRKILLDFIKCNKLDNVELFENLAELNGRDDIRDINLVFGEPYFTSSILPWDNLLFVYLVNGARRFLAADVQIFPQNAIIKAIAVNFKDLYKIRCPLGACEEFQMKEFDDLIDESSNISDDNVEAQPLWEYPGIALSKTVEVASINLIEVPEKVLETKGTFEIDTGLNGCNGVALWIEWLYEEMPRRVVSCGPVAPATIGQNIKWDMHTRQGVCLFPKKNEPIINYHFKFDFDEGNISFKCN